MTTFRLPDLGEGLQEAEIVSWHVGAGDRVVADQPLVSVETAKAVVEVPAPWAGRVLTLHGQQGDLIKVGAPLADIESEAEIKDAGTVVGTLPPAGTIAPSTTRDSLPLTDSTVKASPAVRKRARELGVLIDKLKGSGPGGTVTSDDVEAAVRQAYKQSDFVALRGVRRAMAETMAQSGAEVVPATVTDEAIIEAWSAGSDPTVRLVRAIAVGCRAAPELNAWLDGKHQSRRLHDSIDLGLAMETQDGLFAPVLRNVANRSDTDLRAGLEAMKRDVAARTVPLAELRGQTFTLSNFGMLGGLHAALAIVPPQVAILGAGRIHSAARVVSGEVRAARVMPLSLTFDHRAVTGAEAIRFLRAVIDELEQPEATSFPG
jgi:pyruvate dehydrogenase E2 component (dihydrolipoamide acetyltransferase)